KAPRRFQKLLCDNIGCDTDRLAARPYSQMFHYDSGLFLTAAQLGVDVRRRQPRCFVSHAHTDHIARHELALATAATAALYRHRLGPRHRVLEMPYRQPVEFGGMQLTALPAGHC